MEIVEKRIGPRRQRPDINHGALSGRHHFLAIELGALKLRRHFACVLDLQLEFDAGLDTQGARLEAIVVDGDGVRRLLRRKRCRTDAQHATSDADGQDGTASQHNSRPNTTGPHNWPTQLARTTGPKTMFQKWS